MGPKDSETPDLVLYMKSGETPDLVLYTKSGERLGPIRNLPEVTIATGKEIAAAMRPAIAAFKEAISISVKPGKHWRCRNRKRFIKLLMSKGISRNQAEGVARVARIAGVQYGKLWQGYFFWGERI